MNSSESAEEISPLILAPPSITEWSAPSLRGEDSLQSRRRGISALQGCSLGARLVLYSSDLEDLGSARERTLEREEILCCFALDLVEGAKEFSSKGAASTNLGGYL